MIKKLLFPGEKIFGWHAVGDKDEDGYLGELAFARDENGGTSAQAVPNRHFRFDSIRQGDRLKNPYLRESSCFPLLYALATQTKWSGKSYYDFGDLTSQLRKCKVFQCAIAVEKHKRENCKERRNTQDGIPILKIPFDSNCNYQIGVLARKELMKLLVHAAEMGSRDLGMVAKAAKAVEGKLRPPEGEELLFIEALAELTKELEEVPTQRELREFFLSRRSGRTEEHFKKLRDRLGFKWLPQAKRGPNTLPK